MLAFLAIEQQVGVQALFQFQRRFQPVDLDAIDVLTPVIDLRVKAGTGEPGFEAAAGPLDRKAAVAAHICTPEHPHVLGDRRGRRQEGRAKSRDQHRYSHPASPISGQPTLGRRLGTGRHNQSQHAPREHIRAFQPSQARTDAIRGPVEAKRGVNVVRRIRAGRARQ